MHFKVLTASIIATLLSGSCSLSMSSSTTSATTSGANVKSAVIIGGDPIGLAASLMLEKCGYTDITIVEKRSTDSFEPTKAFVCLLDQRGRRCSDLIGNISQYSWPSLSFLLSETPTVVKTERCGVCVRLRRRVCLGERDKDRVRARVIAMMTIANLIFSGKLIDSTLNQILDYNAMYNQLTPKYMHSIKLIPNEHIFVIN